MLRQRLEERRIITAEPIAPPKSLPKPDVPAKKNFGSMQVVETLLIKQMDLCERLAKEQDLTMIDRYVASINGCQDLIRKLI